MEPDRPPLNAASLRRGLVRPETLWTDLEVVGELGSTNTELANRARSGTAEGAVLIAEWQTAGRGRLERTWTVPPRGALTFSVLLRPTVPASRYGWLPLLVAVAAAGALRDRAGVDVGLKWPNDLLVRDRKLAGILAEVVGGGQPAGVVVGMGLNVTLRAAELPVPAATSLALEEATCTDRDPLVRAILRQVETRYREWRDAGGDPDTCGLRAAYTSSCVTLGREVTVRLPGDERLAGGAHDVDAAGRLVVRTEVGDRAVSSGDVVHVR